jgi:hypothetical protein
MSFDLSEMERGEICHDRCMVLLLATSAQPDQTRDRDVQVQYVRGRLTIQSLNKKNPEQDVISKNKHPTSQNIQLRDGLLSAGFVT